MWTDSRRDKVKKLWALGLTMTEVGERLGKTRSAIAGLINRNNWQRNAPARQPQPRPVAQAVGVNPLPTPAAAPASVVPLHCTLEEIGRGCHYPFHGETYSFCGLETKPGSSYCEFHHEVCHKGVLK